MALATATDPLSLLRELLLEDRAAGMSWDELCFPQVVDVVCRGVPGGEGYRQPLIETANAWRAAYERETASTLGLDQTLGHTDWSERSPVSALG